MHTKKINSDKKWSKIWTTEYSMFSVWLFGREYSEICKRELGFGFDDIVFLIEGDLATVFRDDNKQEEFANYLAKRSLLEPRFKDSCLKTYQKISEKIRSYLYLSEREILEYGNLMNFIAIHKKFTAYFLVPLWAPNGFEKINAPDGVKKQTFKEFEKARKFSEHIYPDIEKFIQKIYAYISKREKVDEKILRALLPDELISYSQTGKLPSVGTLKSRYSYCVLLADMKNNRIVLGKEAASIIHKISKTEPDDKKILKGMVANRGMARGKVRKIFLEGDMGNFKKGEILVTTMTRPEWLPIMKLAGAFVTDAGGVLSHAAIVSRELNKPCIIGTRIATKVLKDGDLVKVDAQKGVVNILKK